MQSILTGFINWCYKVVFHSAFNPAASFHAARLASLIFRAGGSWICQTRKLCSALSEAGPQSPAPRVTSTCPI